MHTHTNPPNTTDNPPAKSLVTIAGLRNAAFWPPDRRPSLRTLREWSRTRRIPAMKIGKFVMYDPEAVHSHLELAFTIKPR